MDVMGRLAWIIVGGLAGWLASMVTHSRVGLVGEIILGIIGALVGGVLFNLIGAPGATGFNLWSVFVAFIGAAVVLGVIHLFSGPRVTV